MYNNITFAAWKNQHNKYNKLRVKSHKTSMRPSCVTHSLPSCLILLLLFSVR